VTPAAVNPENGQEPAVASRVGLLLGLTALLLAWRFWALPRLGITLYVDEAQYWTWAQQLDWGYFSKPPGIAALIWLSTALFGDGIVGVKALGMLCYPLAATACWAIARRLYNEEVAFWSALVVVTVPMFAWLGLFVSTDALLTLFWALALWAYLRALDHDRWRDWLLLGVVCGLGLLSKYTMAAFLGAAFLHLLGFERARLKTAGPWLAALTALALLAPNLWWNVAHDFPTLKHTADITLKRQAAGGLKSLGEFWAAQWLAFGPVLGSVFIALLAGVRRTWRDDRLRLLIWFSLPLWAVVSLQALKSNANANWAAPAFAPAAIAVVAWLLARERRRVGLINLPLNLALVGLVYHWPQVLATVNAKNPAKSSPFTRARGWDDLGRQLQPLLAAHPQAVLVADNRTLIAHMLYELRAQKPLAASWNPEGEASDHYKLSTDLRPYRGRDLLLITENEPGERFLPYVAGQRKLATLRAPLDAHTTRDLHVWLLSDFQGY